MIKDDRTRERGRPEGLALSGNPDVVFVRYAMINIGVVPENGK